MPPSNRLKQTLPQKENVMAANPLSKINNIVVVMLENRSFDHMLGFLYEDSKNVSPLGHPFRTVERHGNQSGQKQQAR
jgi:phospholipase C